MLESLIVTFAAAIDVFAGCFAYGCNKIKIYHNMLIFMTFICTLCMMLAFFLGNLLKSLLSPFLTTLIAFILLFFIGLIKLLDWYIKTLIRKWIKNNKPLNFCLFNFKFMLNVYANPETAMGDQAKSISLKEGTLLAIALTIDGMTGAFSLALIGINGWYLLFWAIITHYLAITLGSKIGNMIAHKLKYQIEWLSGLILIIIAFIKLI